MCTTGELVKDTLAERVLAASGFEPCHVYISNHETQLLSIVRILQIDKSHSPLSQVH